MRNLAAFPEQKQGQDRADSIIFHQKRTAIRGTHRGKSVSHFRPSSLGSDDYVTCMREHESMLVALFMAFWTAQRHPPFFEILIAILQQNVMQRTRKRTYSGRSASSSWDMYVEGNWTRLWKGHVNYKVNTISHCLFEWQQDFSIESTVKKKTSLRLLFFN